MYGAHVDADADPLAGVVGHAGVVALPAVLVGDVVRFDALFVIGDVARIAALHGAHLRIGHLFRSAALAGLVTDRGADQRARGRRRLAAIAAADLRTQHAADQAAQDHVAGDTGGGSTRFFVFLDVALTLRRLHAHLARDRLHVDDTRVLVRGTNARIAAVGLRLVPCHRARGDRKAAQHRAQNDSRGP